MSVNVSISAIQTELHNLTNDVGYVVHNSQYHSVWSLLKGRMKTLVSDAVKQASERFQFSDGVMNTMKKHLNHYLGVSLADVAYDHQVSDHNLSSQIKQKVGDAVDSTLQDLHMNITSNFTHKLFTALDTEIEMDTLGKIINGSTHTLVQADNAHNHHDTGKSESTLAVLVCLGVLVPIIIFTMLGIYLYRRRMANRGLRHEMLLTEQHDFVDDPHDEDVPDLNLRNMRI